MSEPDVITIEQAHARAIQHIVKVVLSEGVPYDYWYQLSDNWDLNLTSDATEDFHPPLQAVIYPVIGGKTITNGDMYFITAEGIKESPCT